MLLMSLQFLAFDFGYTNMLLRHSDMTSEAGRMFFSELCKARDFVRPIPWLDRLTNTQQAKVLEMGHYSQSEGWEDLVDEWMRAWPLLSVDMESNLGDPLPFAVQVVLRKSLQVFIFHLDLLWVDHPTWRQSDSVSVLELLPPHLVQHQPQDLHSSLG